MQSQDVVCRDLAINSSYVREFFHVAQSKLSKDYVEIGVSAAF